MGQVEVQLPRGAAPHTPPRALEEAEPSQSLRPARSGCGDPGNQRFWATAPHWAKWTPGPKGPGPYSDRPFHALTKMFAFKSDFITIQDKSKMRNPV